MGEDPQFDPAFDDEAMEQGRLLFARACTFVTSAADMGGLPAPALPEVAFAGRSNVGKSSLINALTGHKGLARTSSTPGRTQLLNFFDLAGRLMLVDLPGYGYAAAPKDTVARWQALVDDFLRGRAPLRRVCLLIDARHGPKEVDRTVMDMLDTHAVVFQVVLTKADKIPAPKLEKVRQDTAAEMARHTAAFPLLIATSSAKDFGLADLRASLAGLALPAASG